MRDYQVSMTKSEVSMQRTGTTNDFTYNDDLMTELLLAYQAALNYTKSEDAALGILQSYKDMRIAQYHRDQDEVWAMPFDGPENG